MRKIGKIIYSYRKINELSQDELADIVGVSSAAVSKWERDVSFPDVEVLCKLAEYFEVSVDRLLGRDLDERVDIQFDNQQEADRYYTAMQLLECCTIARESGLLAVEEFVKNKDKNRGSFLKFAVEYLLKEMRENYTPQEIKIFLMRYAETEKDQYIAKMIIESLVLIFSGENEKYIKEVLRSFLGRKYAFLIPYDEQQMRWKMGRSEAIEYYAHIDCGTADTKLLDEVLDYDNMLIQQILCCISNTDLLNALAGASIEVRVRLLKNLSDRMIYFIGEDMLSETVQADDVYTAQNKILELGKSHQ